MTIMITIRVAPGRAKVVLVLFEYVVGTSKANRELLRKAALVSQSPTMRANCPSGNYKYYRLCTVNGRCEQTII